MIKCFSHGLLGSNTFVIYDGNEGMIVDCGNEPTSPCNFIKEKGLDIKYIVLTHGHFDHIAYVNEYARIFDGAKIICHIDELPVIYDPEGNLSSFFGAGCEYRLDYTPVSEGDIITLGELSFKVISCPGHTPGSMCLLCKDKNFMLTGDVLFKSGWGRTDFKYGDSGKMKESLMRLFKLEPELEFYAGHGEKSKIKHEIQ